MGYMSYMSYVGYMGYMVYVGYMSYRKGERFKSVSAHRTGGGPVTGARAEASCRCHPWISQSPHTDVPDKIANFTGSYFCNDNLFCYC